jgi:hypothetical protein
MSKKLSLRGFSGGQTRAVEGDPRPANPSPGPFQPQPTEKVSVPKPAPTSFSTPAPKKMADMKTPKDLKSVSEALADGKAYLESAVTDTTEAGGSHVKTPDAQEHDLKGVSESINTAQDEHELDEPVSESKDTSGQTGGRPEEE